jgi:hypothetical protein
MKIFTIFLFCLYLLSFPYLIHCDEPNSTADSPSNVAQPTDSTAAPVNANERGNLVQLEAVAAAASTGAAEAKPEKKNPITAMKENLLQKIESKKKLRENQPNSGEIMAEMANNANFQASAAPGAVAVAPMGSSASTSAPEPPPLASMKSLSSGSELDEGDRFNYAAVDAGAKLLATSPGMKKANSILIHDADRYLMVPCAEQHKFFIIQLSEDINIEAVEIANYEHYSSGVKGFQLLGATQHPTDNWHFLGEFQAQNNNQQQNFKLSQTSLENHNNDGDNGNGGGNGEISGNLADSDSSNLPSLSNQVRYLKFLWLSHYKDEYYCTLTYFKVFGQTVLEEFRAELEKSEREVQQVKEEIKNVKVNEEIVQPASISNAEEVVAAEPLAEPLNLPNVEEGDSENDKILVLDSEIFSEDDLSGAVLSADAIITAKNISQNMNNNSNNSAPETDNFGSANTSAPANSTELPSNSTEENDIQLSAANVASAALPPTEDLSVDQQIQHSLDRLATFVGPEARAEAEQTAKQISKSFEAEMEKLEASKVSETADLATSEGLSTTELSSAASLSGPIPPLPASLSVHSPQKAIPQSIFKVLTNRIKELEIGQAISGQFLADLAEQLRAESLQFHSKITEINQRLNGQIMATNSTLQQNFKKLNETYYLLREKHRNMRAEMREKLAYTQHTLNLVEMALILEFLVFLGLLAKKIWPKCRKCCRKCSRGGKKANRKGGRLRHKRAVSVDSLIMAQKSAEIAKIHVVNEQGAANLLQLLATRSLPLSRNNSAHELSLETPDTAAFDLTKPPNREKTEEKHQFNGKIINFGVEASEEKKIWRGD